MGSCSRHNDKHSRGPGESGRYWGNIELVNINTNMISVNYIPILSIVIYSAFIHDGTSSFMIAGDKRSECFGSITLNNNSDLTFYSSVSDINLEVHTVRMEGCGCFRLHQRNGGRGRSLRINQQGVTKVALGRVRSIVTEQCFSGRGVSKEEVITSFTFQTDVEESKLQIQPKTKITENDSVTNKGGTNPKLRKLRNKTESKL